MDIEDREALAWAAIGMRDAAGLIARELERPEPDAGGMKEQLCRAQRCICQSWDVLLRRGGGDGVEQ